MAFCRALQEATPSRARYQALCLASLIWLPPLRSRRQLEALESCACIWQIQKQIQLAVALEMLMRRSPLLIGVVTH
jgi:hypothetical protein